MKTRTSRTEEGDLSAKPHIEMIFEICFPFLTQFIKLEMHAKEIERLHARIKITVREKIL